MSLPAIPSGDYWYDRHKGRSWAVFSPQGDLVCVTLYRKGAEEAVRLLNSLSLSLACALAAHYAAAPAARPLTARFGPWEPAFPPCEQKQTIPERTERKGE